jgi:hypothetical protein
MEEMMSRLICATCLFAVVVLGSVEARAQQVGSPPVVPSMKEPGRFKEYARAAQIFLRDHTDSPEAPRVTFDMMLLLSVTDNVKGEQQLKKILLKRYPLSPYAVFAVRSFPKPEKCREFLQEFFREGVRSDFPSAILERFAFGVNVGLDKYGHELLSDEDFLLQCAFAGSASEKTTVVTRVREKLQSANEETQQIARILMSVDPSSAERFLALRPFSGRSGVRRILPYLQAGMTAAEKNSSAVQLAVAKTYLRDGKLAEAYPILKGLQNEDSDVQLVTWTAWAAAASGDKDTALQLLGGIVKDASDPAKESARQLAASLPDHEAALDAHATALHAISQQFLKGDQAIEISGRYVPEEGAPLAFYLAYDEASRFADAVIRKNDLVMAVRIDGEKASVSLPGEDVEHMYATGSSLPQPKFELSQSPEGAVSFNFNAAIGDKSQAGQGSVQSLFASPMLSTKARLHALLSAGIKRGSFPEVVNDADTGDRILRWISLQMDEPVPHIVELRVSPEGRLTALRADNLVIDHMRYGKRGSFEFAPPVVPERTVQRHETAAPSMMFQLFGAVTTLLESGG